MHCAYSLKIIESAFHRAAVAMSHSLYQESVHTDTQRSKTCTKERETHSHIMPVIIIYNSLHIECCLKWRLISSNILSFTYLCRVLFRRLVFFLFYFFFNPDLFPLSWRPFEILPTDEREWTIRGFESIFFCVYFFSFATTTMHGNVFAFIRTIKMN